MDYKNIISEIIGDKNIVDIWVSLKPKVYYKNNKPFGLITTYNSEDGYKYLATACIDVNYNFTIGMIRDIIRYYKKEPICLVSNTKNRHKIIIKALNTRFKFTHKTTGNTLFSFGDNHNV